jgi:8-oxo-dGTP diphosphatase
MSAARGARPVTDVAVGVVLRADGSALLADRPAGKPYAGYWEFPGGKVESGETVAAALARELHEELGVDIERALPWVVFEFDYPHAYVRLHFCRVDRWKGEPHPKEGQRFGFFAPAATLPSPLLPAAEPALRWLTLPSVYAISDAASLGRARFLSRLDGALASGLRQIQLREPSLADDELATLFEDVLARVRAHGARLLVSSRHPPRFWERADGVHLTAAALRACGRRPPVQWVGASVHSREQIAHAAALSCDFAALGSVLPTATHPGVSPLGWEGFARIAADPPLPVYALGGLTRSDLDTALCSGAHGIALLRAAWRQP